MRIVADVLMEQYLVVEIWKEDTLIGGYYQEIYDILTLGEFREVLNTILEVIEYAEQIL